LIKVIFNFNEIEELKDKLPIFGTKEYLEYKSSSYGWFVSEKFILPFYVKNKLIFKRLFFTTEVIHLNNSTTEEENDFLNEVINLSRKNEVDIIELPGSNAIFNTYPDGAFYTEFGTYKLDLNKTEEELFSGLHSKNRNVIRKA
jgi:hypothetical protein